MPAIDELSVELDTYRTLHARLVEEHDGKYVLITGDRLVGVFDDERSALAAGYGEFGYVPLLVKRVTAVESPAIHASYFVP